MQRREVQLEAIRKTTGSVDLAISRVLSPEGSFVFVQYTQAQILHWGDVCLKTL